MSFFTKGRLGKIYLNPELCLKNNKIILEYPHASENKEILREIMGMGQKKQESA